MEPRRGLGHRCLPLFQEPPSAIERRCVRQDRWHTPRILRGPSRCHKSRVSILRTHCRFQSLRPKNPSEHSEYGRSIRVRRFHIWNQRVLPVQRLGVSSIRCKSNFGSLRNVDQNYAEPVASVLTLSSIAQIVTIATAKEVISLAAEQLISLVSPTA